MAPKQSALTYTFDVDILDLAGAHCAVCIDEMTLDTVVQSTLCVNGWVHVPSHIYVHPGSLGAGLACSLAGRVLDITGCLRTVRDRERNDKRYLGIISADDQSLSMRTS